MADKSLPSEHEALQVARDGFRRAEAQMARVIDALTHIEAINNVEGRYQEANAAFVTRALATQALGAVQLAHGRGTEALFKHWPSEALPRKDGGVIVQSGHR